MNDNESEWNDFVKRHNQLKALAKDRLAEAEQLLENETDPKKAEELKKKIRALKRKANRKI